MKKSCNDCRAFRLSGGMFNHPYCELGYDFTLRPEEIDNEVRGAFSFAPTTNCPKPRTWEQMWKACEALDNNRKISENSLKNGEKNMTKPQLTKYSKTPMVGGQINPTDWSDCIDQDRINFQKGTWNKLLEENSFEFGALSVSLAKTLEQYKIVLTEQKRLKFLIEILDKTTPENYGDFDNEVYFAKFPQEEIKEVDDLLITDEVVLAYMEKKYGLKKAMLLKSLMENE